MFAPGFARIFSRALSASLAALFVSNCAGVAAPPAQPRAGETPYTFKAQTGEEVDAFRGEVKVPENRADANSREITLGYVRFPATGAAPGSPIVYLAGGPGGSGVGTAEERRFPLFMAMREFGDVIAFDQRGTGWSNMTPRCEPQSSVPLNEPLGDVEIAIAYRALYEECGRFWKASDADLRGYTTLESARDLDALRAHLGAKKITLWAISYGTHLSLAAVKEMGPRIDKMVLTGVEGLDQTVKMPNRTDAYFDRLQAVIDQNPSAKERYPDIKGLMRRVFTKLEQEPYQSAYTDKDGAAVSFYVTRPMMQLIAAFSIADPEGAASMLRMFAAADAGDFKPAANIIGAVIAHGRLTDMRLMPVVMDVASGVDDKRLAMVQKQAETSILGDYLNFPMPHIRGVFDGLDLGDDFRKAPNSNIPTLVLSGTLDGRTYPESHREATAGLRKAQHVTIENAGHNLFMSSPDVTVVIQRFMRGENVDGETIIIPPPSFE